MSLYLAVSRRQTVSQYVQNPSVMRSSTSFISSLQVVIATTSGALAAAVQPTTEAHCKVTPNDAAWPCPEDWSSLNATIGGKLIKTHPAASSCYSGNPLDSPLTCDYVTEHWGFSSFHSDLPESVGYSVWANNSCIPPDATGYSESLGCSVGGYPQFVVNTTSAEDIAYSMKWAAERNIRIVVKGTGHELNGRYVILLTINLIDIIHLG